MALFILSCIAAFILCCYIFMYLYVVFLSTPDGFMAFVALPLAFYCFMAALFLYYNASY